MSKASTIDLDLLKEKLLSERREMRHDAEISAAERATVVLDQTTVGRLSRMDALQTQAMALETERRREVELKRIDMALERMDAGEYGACTSCGEDIQPKRLEMDPATPVCIDCASKSG